MPTQHSTENGGGTGRVRIISRRVVRANPLPPSVRVTVHLTPWDLRLITIDYIQKGVLLPKPNPHPPPGDAVVDHLASAFARALGQFHQFAGLLAVDERGSTNDGTATTVSLRCTNEGADFVHAAAPGVAAADIVGSIHIPRDLVASLFPLNGLVSADAAASADGGARRAPLLAAQVTELDDAVFVAASLNHAAGDGTTFWHFMNTWSHLSRTGVNGRTTTGRPPPQQPVLQRWFPDTCPVPVPLPFAKLEDVVKRCHHAPPPVDECFFHFSAESVKKLKARANAELMNTTTGQAPSTITISSLQALLAHLWRSVCRARQLPPSQETSYVLLIGCRGRVKRIERTGYVGNAVVPCKVTSTAGDVVEKGLGWAALQLNRMVASFGDEAAMVRDSIERWVREPRFAYTADMLSGGAGAVGTGGSPRFDVYGNDFGLGVSPVAVRSGPANKMDGKTTVYEGRRGQVAMGLEVCLAPDALARLVADKEFMAAVTVP